MNKREDIKRGLLTSIHRWDKHRELTLGALVSLILRNLSEKGVVIKVDRKRLLEYDNYNDPTRELDDRFETAQVEPIIEESK